MAKKRLAVRTWKLGAAGIFSIIAGSAAVGRGAETLMGAPEQKGILER